MTLMREPNMATLIKGVACAGWNYEVPHRGFWRFLNGQSLYSKRLIGSFWIDAENRVPTRTGYP